jgi:thiamine biosynthesis lipoprotein
LLDPRTGQPAIHTQAITVVASDATLADAASTALFIAGPDAWQSVALRMGVSQVLRIDANGRIEATKEMVSRLRTTAQDREIFGVELLAVGR